MSELYVVATPIGNLGDITSRALEVLRDADLIAAEDTRHSGRLLQHFGIQTPLRSYHEHNEKDQTDWLIERLKEGKRIALISDAGTPLISDPGYQLVRTARQQGIRVIPIPGASALIAALSASGLASDRFVFEGFLPAKSKGRKERLACLKQETRTAILYESPHRILASVADMKEVLGEERRLVLARELTKTFETIYDDTLAGMEKWLHEDSNQQRGEMVLLLEGIAPAETDQDIEQAGEVLAVLVEELPVKQAAGLAAKITGRNKNELYRMALELKKDNH